MGKQSESKKSSIQTLFNNPIVLTIIAIIFLIIRILPFSIGNSFCDTVINELSIGIVTSMIVSLIIMNYENRIQGIKKKQQKQEFREIYFQNLRLQFCKFLGRLIWLIENKDRVLEWKCNPNTFFSVYHSLTIGQSNQNHYISTADAVEKCYQFASIGAWDEAPTEEYLYIKTLMYNHSRSLLNALKDLEDNSFLLINEGYVSMEELNELHDGIINIIRSMIPKTCHFHSLLGVRNILTEFSSFSKQPITIPVGMNEEIAPEDL